MTDTPSRPPDAPNIQGHQKVVAVGVVGMVALLIVTGIAIFAAPAMLDRARPGSAVMAPDGVQEVTVEVANGIYEPNVIRAKAGVPLRLRVDVRERHSCATKLLVPDLGLDFDLPAGGTAVLTIPASKPGAYLFTCGQKMVKGSIVLE
jgi:plastocyanin domain-containing protein